MSKRTQNRHTQISNMLKYQILICLVAVYPSLANAQGGINISDLINKHVLSKMGEVMSEVLRQRMVVSPEEVVVRSGAREVTISFSNPTKDTMKAEILVYTTPPPQVKVIESAVKKDNRPVPSFLADSDPRKRSSNDKSSGTYKPLSKDWIGNLQDSIILAPGEIREMTLKINVPADADEGLYVAWIASAVEIKKSKAQTTEVSKKQEKNVQVKTRGGLPGDEKRAVLSSAKIMYNVSGPKATSE